MKAYLSLCIAAIFLACFIAIPQSVAAKDRVLMPWPVRYLQLRGEGQSMRMAYMDVPARSGGTKVAVLLHGKNFNGYYWREPAEWLSRHGYRVIIPDQLGFGNSDMPDMHYSFHQLAANTKALLDSLQLGTVVLIGHSMGGMLATRFSLMFPERVQQLILEDPIGLEDYRRMVPFTSIDSQYKTELKATYESYLSYQKGYYPEWKPQYDTLVRIQALALKDPQFTGIAKANALTYDMIYQQPVCYEFENLRVPTLLIVGGEDRTVVGKALIAEAERSKYGQYRALGERTHKKIAGSKLVILDGIGHIPHIQDMKMFITAIAAFLGEKE
jgi:pimeloyl-ACP methyl ester carboxylesterase